MASVFFEASGTARIAFIAPDGYRKQIRFGRIPRRQAEAIGAMLDVLSDSRRGGVAPPAHVVAWRDSLAESTYAALARAGLAGPRQADKGVALGELIARFVAAKAHTCKATRDALRQTTNCLLEHFGPERDIRSLTTADADAWASALASPAFGLAPATRAKRRTVAKQIFNKAVEWGMLSTSPFRLIRVGSQSNTDRLAYVPPDVVYRVVDELPDDYWRGVLLLARFGGLRAPSEHRLLRWCDVRFGTADEPGRLTVRSPKTAGHGADHALRVVPMVPQVVGVLQRLFDRAEPGQELVFPMLTRPVGSPHKNLRKTMLVAMERAGVTAWPRLMNNCRSSCARDWCERFPGHVAARWLGHSERVAFKHYLAASDHHFAEAARDSKSDPLPTQKATRRAFASNRAECTEPAQVSPDTSVTTSDYTCRNSLTNTLLGEAGLEPA